MLCTSFEERHTMKTQWLELRSSLALTLVFAVLLCGVYPLAVWGASQVLFREKADGSLLVDGDGTVRGSALLGQSFSSVRYFHSRPSAAGNGYDATASCGTNLGPTSKKLADAIQTAVAAYRTENHLPEGAAVPADAVTASGSGLDPHISPANAALQTGRVAQARGLAVERVRALIAACTEGPDGGLFGDPGVNVVRLNRALDQETQ